jgi:hypothetical protein
MSKNIVDALKVVIAIRNWDFAAELADEHQFVDCLRCFTAPRRLLFNAETSSVYLCLFCAGCWHEHTKHATHPRARGLADCTVCNVVAMHRSMEEVLALQNLRAAERRFLSAFGWTRDGDSWNPPPGQRFKYRSGYTHNHAVNTLKQRQGESRGPKQPRDPDYRGDE